MKKSSLIFILLSLFYFQAVSQKHEIDGLDNKSKLQIESGTFDSNKPTIVFFGGGDCIDSWNPTESWESSETRGDAWFENANIISLYYYEHDLETEGDEVSYFICAEMVLDTILSLAPLYDKDVQSCGFSTGGTPALDFAFFVNTTKRDISFSVVNVTLMDAPCYAYTDRIDMFVNTGRTTEPRLVVNLMGDLYNEHQFPYPKAININLKIGHDEVYWWYLNLLVIKNGNTFNGGVTGGAFWSVLGKGTNLSLSNKADKVNYYFNWLGSEDSGSFEYMDESKYNGKLPGPVTLKKPAVIGTEILLTCFECENAVSYQILTGSSASKLTTLGDALSDPPSEPIIVPKDDKYWTIRVTDKYATTIFADPVALH